MSDINEMLNGKAFESIEPERKKAFTELAKRIEGKDFNYVLGEVVSFSRNMPKGHNITPIEKQAMIAAVYEGLSKADKVKFESILKMLDGII